MVDERCTVHWIHQEDGTQALGLPGHTDTKIESIERFRGTLSNISGLSPQRKTLFGSGSDDRERLLTFTTFKVAVGNSDADAKNFSMIHLPSGAIKRASLDDVAPSILNADGNMDLAVRINDKRFQPDRTRKSLIAEGVC